MPRSRRICLLAVVLVCAVASCGVEAKDVAGTPPTAPAPPTSPTSTGGETTTTEPDGGGDDTTTTEPDEGGGGDTTTTKPDGGGSGGGGRTGDREENTEEEDTEVFTVLEADCIDGDDRACDLLFLISPSGSEFEDVGGECAGREMTGIFCAEETQFPGTNPEDNPGLPVLADDCRAGDMVACDLLYEISPPGSTEQDLGARCGEEDGDPVAPSCRVANG